MFLEYLAVSLVSQMHVFEESNNFLLYIKAICMLSTDIMKGENNMQLFVVIHCLLCFSEGNLEIKYRN